MDSDKSYSDSLNKLMDSPNIYINSKGLSWTQKYSYGLKVTRMNSKLLTIDSDKSYMHSSNKIMGSLNICTNSK